MSLKIENGSYALTETGCPAEITGREELAQDIRLALTLPRGALRACPTLGSRLGELTGEEEHAAQRAVSLAGEALLDLPGVTVTGARWEAGGIRFTLETPYGEMEVLYGNDQRPAGPDGADL